MTSMRIGPVGCLVAGRRVTYMCKITLTYLIARPSSGRWTEERRSCAPQPGSAESWRLLDGGPLSRYCCVEVAFGQPIFSVEPVE